MVSCVMISLSRFVLTLILGGDQGILNTFFSDWRERDVSFRLPFIYNMTSGAIYSYAAAYKRLVICTSVHIILLFLDMVHKSRLFTFSVVSSHGNHRRQHMVIRVNTLHIGGEYLATMFRVIYVLNT